MALLQVVYSKVLIGDVFFLESLFFCFSTFFESFFLDLDMDFFLDIQSMLLLGGFWVESR